MKAAAFYTHFLVVYQVVEEVEVDDDEKGDVVKKA